MIDIDRMRKLVHENDGRTHYEGCEYVHVQCAIKALCDELEKRPEYKNGPQQDETISVRISRSGKRKLENIAEQEEVPISYIVRRGLELYMLQEGHNER